MNESTAASAEAGQRVTEPVFLLCCGAHMEALEPPPQKTQMQLAPKRHGRWNLEDLDVNPRSFPVGPERGDTP